MDQYMKLQIPGSGEEYYLTMLNASDALAIHEIFSIDEVNDKLLRVPKPYSLELAQARVTLQTTSHAHLLSLPSLSQRTAAFFSPSQKDPMTLPLQAIRHNSPTAPLIGRVCLVYQPGSETNTNVADLAFYLHPSHQGNGVMLAAAKAALAWAKGEVGITNVCVSVDYGNVRSGRLLERIACETCEGGERGVKRGDGVLSWPGVKVRRPGENEVVRGCWTWEWRI